MWTAAHRARHDARLKEIVSLNAVGQIARWLERADPPRSGRATPYGAVVRAIAWHLRIGGPWRACAAGGPPLRTVYGWFRKWQEQGLFDRLLEDVARRRRRAMGRRARPRLSIIDTQAVQCIPVRGPGGMTPPRRCSGASAWPWSMRMAPGWPSRSSPPRCRTATRLRPSMRARRRGPACGRRSWMGPSPLHPVTSGRTGTACATMWSNVTPLRRASSCSRAVGWWNAASAGSCTGVGCCATGLAVWTSPPLGSRSRPACPASRPCSTLCQSKTPQGNLTQTGSKAIRTNKSFIGVLWGAWSDGVVAHWVELIALEVEAAISSFTDLGPPQTRFTHSCVCPKLRDFAAVHSTSAQRLFNLLCLAYGSNPKAFAALREMDLLKE